MPSCSECDDTGYIDTGNNVLPCHCPAGDTADFNVAGQGVVSGARLKRQSAITQFPTRLADRTEFGHLFKWRGGAWHSTSGQNVEVVPPSEVGESWRLVLPDQNNETLEFRGHDAEERIFCSAEVYTRQLLGTS